MPANTGGPAFPMPIMYRPDGEYMGGPYHGMTLRQWYAGMAMLAIKASDYGHGSADEIADEAYAQADAMLAHEANEVKP